MKQVESKQLSEFFGFGMDASLVWARQLIWLSPPRYSNIDLKVQTKEKERVAPEEPPYGGG